MDRIFEYVVELVPEIAARKEEVKAALREEFGGERRYVSKRREQLGSQILSLFNGRNATEVARKLKIHRTTVYRYLKQPGRR